MSTLGWFASVASSVYALRTQIKAMVEVTALDYALTSWQYTLIMLAFVVTAIVFNTRDAPVLPSTEFAILVGHAAGFVITIVLLLVLCTKNSANEVFVNVQNNVGWSNTGTAYPVSQVTVMYCNLGSDSVVHISEEVNDISVTAPRRMWCSYVGNALFGITMLIAMLFCIGPLDDAVITIHNRALSIFV